ncbi:PepSY domain-containing protein [Methylophaga nitratireducenticrescens]|uniref:PepSY-associated TM helix domain-containing protein n=1 Tax=Methylophaga nitratireducenticrescens TaxID=754476 RepID=UPI00059C4529|nr:PepSY-associated TM helix domain-containing protein [Methylophaga nitratireducenticrescens]AFI83048.2 PepSY domain-containing protein [Methylophaga nitratireducenticrescens]
MRNIIFRRRFWVLLHRWVGVFILLFIVIAGLTGSAIAFWRAADQWLNPAWYLVDVGDDPQLLKTLSEQVLQTYPTAKVHGIILAKDNTSSVIFYLAGEPTGIDEVFINPYTGQILGGRDIDRTSLARSHLMPFLYRLHYSLGLGSFGKYLLGVVTVLWLVVTLIGIWLAWPKKNKWQKVLSIKYTAGSSRLLFDLHRSFGLIFSVLFLLILWTGLWWNMDVVIRPVITSIFPVTPTFHLASKAVSQVGNGFNKAVEAALEVRPDSEAYYLRNHSEKGFYTVYLREKGSAGPYGNIFVFVGLDGTILHVDEPQNNLSGDSYAAWQLPLHTGQFLGISGRIIWMVTGFIPLLLTITGVALWLRKVRLQNLKRNIN